MTWQPGPSQQGPTPPPNQSYPPQGPQPPYPPQGGQQPYPQGQQPPSGRPNSPQGQPAWPGPAQPQNPPQPWPNGPQPGAPYPQPWQNPPQPGAQYPPAPGPQWQHRAPGRAGNKLKWLVPGAVVAVAAIVGAAFALTSGGHSTGGAAGGTAASAGTGTGGGAVKPVPKWQAVSAQHHALATWTYKDSLVVAGNTEITAYNQATGAVLWRTQAPVVQNGQKFNTMFCGGSPSASGSMAVVGLGVVTDTTGIDSDCHSITSLNLATGKLGWLDALPSQAEQVTYAESLDGQPGIADHGLVVDVSGNTVVAQWTGVIAAFSLSTGARKWVNVIGGDKDFENSSAEDIAISGASTYAVMEQVFPPAMQLLRINTATGKVARKVTITKSMTGLAKPLAASILSVAPLTMAFEQVETTDDSSVVGFTPSLTAGWVLHGEPRHAGDPEYFANPAAGGNDQAHQFWPFALGNGLFAAVTISKSDGAGNTLVAFDAATGAKKWTATVPGAEFWEPVAVTGSVVQAVAISDSGRANPMFVSLDAATGKVLSTGQPRAFGPTPLGQANAFYRYVLAGGHVYGVNWGITQSAKGSLPSVFSLN